MTGFAYNNLIEGSDFMQCFIVFYLLGVGCWHMSTYHGIHVEVRGQLVGILSQHPPPTL